MTDNGTHVDVWLKGVGRRFVESLMGKSDQNEFKNRKFVLNN
jgi:hypothetical protein